MHKSLSDKSIENLFPLFADTSVFFRKLIHQQNPSSHFQQPRPKSRPLIQTFATIRTRRKSDADLYSSSQFFSAENFSSFIDLDSGEPVREISDQELTRLGFPVPTSIPPNPIHSPNPIENFPIVDSPFFQIISRKYINSLA